MARVWGLGVGGTPGGPQCSRFQHTGLCLCRFGSLPGLQGRPPQLYSTKPEAANSKHQPAWLSKSSRDSADTSQSTAEKAWVVLPMARTSASLTVLENSTQCSQLTTLCSRPAQAGLADGSQAQVCQAFAGSFCCCLCKQSEGRSTHTCVGCAACCAVSAGALAVRD